MPVHKSTKKSRAAYLRKWRLARKLSEKIAAESKEQGDQISDRLELLKGEIVGAVRTQIEEGSEAILARLDALEKRIEQGIGPVDPQAEFDRQAQAKAFTLPFKRPDDV